MILRNSNVYWGTRQAEQIEFLQKRHKHPATVKLTSNTLEKGERCQTNLQKGCSRWAKMTRVHRIVVHLSSKELNNLNRRWTRGILRTTRNIRCPWCSPSVRLEVSPFEAMVDHNSLFPYPRVKHRKNLNRRRIKSERAQTGVRQGMSFRTYEARISG